MLSHVFTEVKVSERMMSKVKSNETTKTNLKKMRVFYVTHRHKNRHRLATSFSYKAVETLNVLHLSPSLICFLLCARLHRCHYHSVQALSWVVVHFHFFSCDIYSVYKLHLYLLKIRQLQWLKIEIFNLNY